MVSLTWDTVSDATTYKIERSLGGDEWVVLQESLTANFDDISTEFATKYYYRVAAIDAAGNASPYATTELATNDFEANVVPEEATTICSDNNSVCYEISAGTFSEELSCAVSESSVIPPKNSLIKPNSLTCKNKSGDEITEYKNPIRVVFQASGKQAAAKMKIVSVTGKKASLLNSSVDEKQNIRTLEIEKPLVLAAVKSGGSAWLWILLAAAVAAIVGGFIVMMRRRQSETMYTNGPLASAGNPYIPKPTPGVVPGTTTVAPAPHYETAPLEEHPLQSARDRLNHVESPEDNIMPPTPAHPSVPPPSPAPNPTNHADITRYHDPKK